MSDSLPDVPPTTTIFFPTSLSLEFGGMVAISLTWYRCMRKSSLVSQVLTFELLTMPRSDRCGLKFFLSELGDVAIWHSFTIVTTDCCYSTFKYSRPISYSGKQSGSKGRVSWRFQLLRNRISTARVNVPLTWIPSILVRNVVHPSTHPKHIEPAIRSSPSNSRFSTFTQPN